MTLPVGDIVAAAVAGIEAIISLASHLGQRDAVLAAIDASLAAARGRTDADLAAKRRRPQLPLGSARLDRALIRGGPLTADDLATGDTEPPPVAT